jgi:integrase
MPTGSITSADIISVLTPIWQEIPDTARQVRNRICTVLDYSHAKGWRSREAPSGNGSLKAGRGLPRQVKEKDNRKAMPYVAIPGFMIALRRKPSYTRLALDLLILTGFRSQEVRLATWEEFDLDQRLWTIPAEHMKRSRAHIVPLSEAAPQRHRTPRKAVRAIHQDDRQGESGVRTSCADFDPDFLTLANSLYQKRLAKLT